MPIDNCQHTFERLAREVLPKHMTVMRKAIESPRAVADFLEPGVGVKTLLRRHGRDADFPGCYVLLLEGAPYYVGISRNLYRRVRHHCRGEKQNQATLAYSMASKRFVLTGTRKARMDDDGFFAQFQIARQTIQNSTFAYVQIDNDLELYLFEAYCAMELNTGDYNSFRTH